MPQMTDATGGAMGAADALALTDAWAARTLDRMLKGREVFQPTGIEYEDLLVIARTAAWQASKSYEAARGMTLQSWVITQTGYAVREACRNRRHDGARAATVHRLRTVSLETLRTPDGKLVEFADPRDHYAPVEAALVAAFLARIMPPRTFAIFIEYYGRDRLAAEVGAEHGIGQQRIYQIAMAGKQQAREALSR
jgi:DNA-directed RNA polymerase specialized sigma subunit